MDGKEIEGRDNDGRDMEGNEIEGSCGNETEGKPEGEAGNADGKGSDRPGGDCGTTFVGEGGAKGGEGPVNGG